MIMIMITLFIFIHIYHYMLCMHLNINATFVSKLNTSEAKYKVNHVFVRIRNIQLQAVSETEYSTAGSQWDRISGHSLQPISCHLGPISERHRQCPKFAVRLMSVKRSEVHGPKNSLILRMKTELVTAGTEQRYMSWFCLHMYIWHRN